MSFDPRPRSFHGGAAILPDLPYATEPVSIGPAAPATPAVAGPAASGSSQKQVPQPHLPHHATHQRKHSASSPGQSPLARQHALPTFTAITPEGPVLSSIKLQPLARTRSSKSAPSSPMGKAQTQGLSPLSTIQPLDLGHQNQGPLGVSPQIHRVQQPYTNGHAHANTFPPLLLNQRMVDPRLLQQQQQQQQAQVGAVGVPPEMAMRGFTPASGSPSAQAVQQLRYPIVGIPGAVPGPASAPVNGQRGMSHPQPTVQRRPTVPSRISSQASSASSDDTEVDSDSTFVPGRVRSQSRSRSQPDLQALRSKAVERWAVTQEHERRLRERERERLSSASGGDGIVRRRSQGRKTPPPIRAQTLATPLSAAYASAREMRFSPRATPVPLTPLTAWPPSTSTSSSSPSASPSLDPTPLHSPPGGMTGSEDADDDLDGDSPSSGSLSFSPRSRRRPRPHVPRTPLPALGLVFDSSAAEDEPLVDLRAASIEARFQRSSLLGFRLLAIVPAMWGIAVLSHALLTGYLWEDPWPWGVDFSREQLDRLVQGNIHEGVKRPVHRGDMVLAIAWALLTAHFCFYLTTGLTYRWRSYYSLPSTITRLVSLQCLCWPATYLTLWFLGPARPLLAWVCIGVTTGGSRSVQMWVTSNVLQESATPGDITPGPSRKGSGISLGMGMGQSPKVAKYGRPPPEGLTGWRVFTWGRRWDWDAVAYKVGWKVGGLLLVTTAWLFWRLEEGGGVASPRVSCERSEHSCPVYWRAS